MEFSKEREQEKDGVLSVWQGFQGSVELVSFPVLSRKQVKRVALGANHSVFLTSDQEVFSCGKNNYGQLGIGELDTEYAFDPVPVTTLDGRCVVEVACGLNHCAVVTKDGSALCWGDSKQGQCGLQQDRVLSPYPVVIQQVSSNTCEHGVQAEANNIKFTEVACGATHTLGLSVDSELWVWGSGPGIGIEGATGVIPPTLIETLSGRNILSICCGENHSIVLVEKSVIGESDRDKRQSTSSIIELKAHKFYPSTCAKCQSEIYTYMETSDTCIISNEHSCEHAQPISGDFSGDGTSNNQSADKSLDNLASGHAEDQPHEDGQEDVNKQIETESDDLTSQKTEEELISTEKENSDNITVTKSEETSISDPNPGCDDVISPRIGEDAISQTIADDQLTSGHQVNDLDPAADSKCPHKDPVTEEKDSKSKDSTMSDVTHQPFSDPLQASAAESTDDKASNIQAVGRSKSFMDGNEALQFLSKQYEDKDLAEIRPKTVEQRSTLGHLWSALPSGRNAVLMQMSAVQQQVSSMTSKAISTVTDKLPFATNQASNDPVSWDLGNVKLDAEGQKPNMESEHDLMSESNSSLDDQSSSISTPSTEDEQVPENTSPQMAESSFIERINEHTPLVDSSIEDLRDGETIPERKSMSVRTLQVKEEQMSKRASVLGPKPDLQVVPSKEVILDTEVWSWGRNFRGQLGIGDSIDRNKPCLVKVLNGKQVVKVTAGSQHSLALTADSQVYSWGSNVSKQLGHSEENCKPTKLKVMSGCHIWDIAAGECFSVFLMDRSGFQPEVHYVGKHPCQEVYVPIYKTERLVALSFLKQAGWIRALSAGGDNCACLSCWSFSGHIGSVFELISQERRFFHHLTRIRKLVVNTLQRHPFYTSLDVYPYKSTLQNLLSSFTKVYEQVGRCYVEMNRMVGDGENVLKASFFSNYGNLADYIKRYMIAFGDMLGISGFEYCGKMGSAYFEGIAKVFTLILEEKKVEKAQFGNTFQKLMAAPLQHVKEYSRLADKLAGNYESGSEEYEALNKVSLKWNSLQHFIATEQTMAANTGVFWETINQQKLVDALKIPSRRLVRDSKTHPLTLQGAGRFSVNHFILFNDLFVHSQYSSYQVFKLETLWVETPSSDSDKKQHQITITAPEDKLFLLAPSTAVKTEWIMALNSTINKVITSQKLVTRRGSMERMAPPGVRQATHTFAKHSIYKDACYTGTFLNGLVHGHGEIKWSDGRNYTGSFRDGKQHGHGRLLILQDDGKERCQEGYWRDGRLHGIGKVKYANGDVYEGYFREGMRQGHGTYRHGGHNSNSASIYIGEWNQDQKQGYGVIDDVLKGEKYMGMWNDGNRHGNGIVVTLDGMYFEGNFTSGKMTGFGLMLTDDNSCYEGDFNGITQLQGKGVLTLPTGDKIEGTFNGSWNEGLKLNGTFHKTSTPDERRSNHTVGLSSSHFKKLCVPPDKRWSDMFHHCSSILGFKGRGKPDTAKAWEAVAVMVTRGRESLWEAKQRGTLRRGTKMEQLEDLEKIPPFNAGKLTIEVYTQIKVYLQKAFDTNFHPLGQVMEGLVDVFRAAYIGVGAHPRLLAHAVQEVMSFIKRLFKIVRILFPDLPINGGPLQIVSEDVLARRKDYPHSDTESIDSALLDSDEKIEIVTAGSLLQPLLLPKIYPPLFDLYALYNDKEDERYWERVQKLNKQGDMALMAYLGIDQRFWLIEEIMFQDKRKRLSSLRDHCYLSSVDTLQQISTAFSPKEKLEVIQKTFLEITKTVQLALNEDHMWCMDELFPVFQYVVVRSKIRHLGAEVHLIEDLMESHLENGELGIMFTTLHACYYQIQNEKLPSH
ncbi:alsin-like isoform X2 [Mizuhopecten yessoensis]|uniref:alsin-like isoform X2 n=1 Tax=Mizuhopecten yessoensis TaxID=6573 RepID=UPI000B45AEF7|nr:alsin-like isoform X2 [Mizuhopecten yessoensis]